MKDSLLSHSLSIDLRVERKALSVNVHANDDFPLVPTADALADANFRFVSPPSPSPSPSLPLITLVQMQERGTSSNVV